MDGVDERLVVVDVDASLESSPSIDRDCSRSSPRSMRAGNVAIRERGISLRELRDCVSDRGRWRTTTTGEGEPGGFA